jgi:hypothetical protein
MINKIIPVLIDINDYNSFEDKIKLFFGNRVEEQKITLFWDEINNNYRKVVLDLKSGEMIQGLTQTGWVVSLKYIQFLKENTNEVISNGGVENININESSDNSPNDGPLDDIILKEIKKDAELKEKEMSSIIETMNFIMKKLENKKPINNNEISFLIKHSDLI